MTFVKWVPPSIRDVATEVTEALAGGRLHDALRIAFKFVEYYDGASPQERSAMVQDEPAPVGDPRFDALLAAVTEFSCARHLERIPPWAGQSSRFLERWWFVSGLRSLHADAIAHSPISFARRGVFITEDALTYA